jgi:hypothetical protein
MLASMLAFRDGNFSVRLPSEWDGIDGQVAAAFNQAVSYEDRLSHELERLSRTVGRAGQLKQRMSVPGAIGGWAAKVDCFNTLMDDLVRPTTEISRTIGAVARGDLGQSIELEVDGRPLEGEFSSLGKAREHDDRAVGCLYFGSHPCSPRSRHRGQARWPGSGQGCIGGVEGTH